MLQYYGMSCRIRGRARQAFPVLAVLLTLAAPALARAGAFEDGVAAYQVKDYGRALALWLPLARQGNGGAQFDVGRMYYYGQGTVRDPVEAVKWFLLASDVGNEEAKQALVMIYPSLTRADIAEATSQANDWRLAHPQR